MTDQPPQDPPAHHRLFFGPEGLRAGWSLLLFFALLFVLGGAATRIAHLIHPAQPHAARHDLPPGQSLLGEAIPFLVITLSTLIMACIERRPLRAYGLGATPRALPQFASGLAAGSILLAALVATLWLTHLLVFTGALLSGAPLLRFAAEWAAAFLLVGLFEEYALRGYLQFTLARGLGALLHRITDSPHARVLGFWIAAALFSFLFGFGHKSNAGESPIGLLSAGLIGLVFCLSLWRTGSLWWAVGFHAAWDWAQSFLFGVADSGTMIRFHLLASHPQGAPLLSGGTTGPEGSLFVLPTILLITLAIVLTLRHTGWPATGLHPARSSPPAAPNINELSS